MPTEVLSPPAGIEYAARCRPILRRLTRDELVDLVRRILAAEAQTEEEDDALLRQFEENVPHPRASDLIFWPEHATGERRELTPEEVVDIALSYKPIQVGPSSQPVDP